MGERTARTHTRRVSRVARKPPALRRAPVVEPAVGQRTERDERATRAVIRRVGDEGVRRALGTGDRAPVAVQPRVTVGPAGDRFEREAEETAARITLGGRGVEQARRAAAPTADADEPRALRRQASDEEAWPEPADGELEALESAGVADADAEGNEGAPVRAARGPGMGPEGGTIQDAALARRIDEPGAGRPLAAATRTTMEPALGADLSAVRVHDAAQDQTDVRALGARAFTRGSDVWLGHGERESDQRLMAHELTHVVQQRGAGTGPDASAQPVRRLFGIDVRAKLAEYARDIPGYSLLTIAIGYDPIAGVAVERSALNVVRGVMSLVPGGNRLFELLNQSGAFERAYRWFVEQFQNLNLTWPAISALFAKAWDDLSGWDLARPWVAWRKIKAVFMPTISRLLGFVRAVGAQVMELVFEGAMALAGPLARRVLGAIRQAGDVVGLIVADPVGFLKNLLEAVGRGVRQFASNILEHLKAGIMGWLFGTLGKAGIKLPEKLDLKGILSLALQILGITYDRIRAKLVKVIGERRVAFVEKAVAFVTVLVTEGVAGAWKKLVEYIGNLKEMVLGAIRNFVVTRIVTAAVTKLVSLFNPVGAIVQAVITIYNFVTWFIERLEQILELVQTVLNSIGEIARGKLSAAANFVEQAMARTLPVIISFLAKMVGLGGVADKIREIVEKIRAKVDQAIDKVVGFIVAKAKALFAKGKAAAKSGVEAVRALLWPRRDFEAGGERHVLYFEGEGDNPPLVMASRKRRFEELVAELKKEPANQSGKRAKDLGVVESKLDEIQDIKKKRPRKRDKPAEFEAETAKIDVAMDVIVMKLGGLLEAGNIGTEANPLELAWPKPESEKYPKIYAGPKVPVEVAIVEQKDLAAGNVGNVQKLLRNKTDPRAAEALKNWEARSWKIDEFTPHGSKALPEGGPTLGIAGTWRIAKKKMLQLPKAAAGTPGGGKILTPLKRYGFDPGVQDKDGDHVTEIQLGGIDDRENLWPLDSKTNRDAGRRLSRQKFKVGGGAEVAMPELKKMAASRPVWFRIASTK